MIKSRVLNVQSIDIIFGIINIFQIYIVNEVIELSRYLENAFV